MLNRKTTQHLLIHQQTLTPGQVVLRLEIKLSYTLL